MKKPESAFYYFYSVGCGFCKKAEPIVDELNKEGYDILKLDLADKDNQGLKKELESKYIKSCGTPWFIDGMTGNQVCGFREKDIIKKWVDGEDIPQPPRPKGPPPKLPFHGASDEEITKWKEDYKKWAAENEHMPNLQPADKILERPRPKYDPPNPPAVNATDEEYNKWGKSYTRWKDDNKHLPNLQPVDTILERLKQRGTNQPVAPGAQNQPMPPQGAGITPDINARFQRIEQKVDKLIKHLGVK